MTWPKVWIIYMALVLGFWSIASSIKHLDETLERIAVQMERR